MRYTRQTLVLTTRGLTKRYGRRLAVDDLTLSVARGDVYGFLGPNGAGKTTTMRMLVGLVHPSAGEVRVLGEPVSPRRRGPLRRVGAIIESPSFYGYLSGRDNLRMLASLTGPCPPSRIDAVLDRVELRDRADDPARIYSHGMKQRLAIAAALLPGPELILLDEPTNGLDPMGIRDMRALVRSLAHDDGLTVFLSSHLLGEVEQVCNRAAIVSAGRARWEGEVAALLAGRRRIRLGATPLDRAARVIADGFGVALHDEVAADGTAWLPARGAAGPIAPADLVDALVAAGVRVHEIAVDEPALEDVFVEMVGAPPSEAA
ncbi:MAG: ABC transporter ATP-binding protein [Kofleriaceae bacterium]|nr:ABC transporter ATP-binding protein [Kofleriaceae bacterium]MCB9575201.1 ABC transporter ATP-binding protein [Kofleriaceae bacterium]